VPFLLVIRCGPPVSVPAVYTIYSNYVFARISSGSQLS